MKRRGLDVERPEARGAVVGRWFLPDWWAGAQPPGPRDKTLLRLAQFAAALAVALVVVVFVGR